ncbi:MAG: ABC transporter substrate-binding protein [Candidatus Eremiobacteraeota bacterium]|nr:ABC transporter substrate-binding protein [Candidatus Eremiobacteraeota bacterium]
MSWRVLVLAACLPALASCAPAQAARDPHTLVVLELGDASTLNPIYSSNYYAFLYQNLVFDQLVGTGDDFADIPLLATSWKSTPDGKHWTVELRKGVRWSDGAPFSSADVVWTWQTLLDPKAGYPYRGQFDYIKSVRADGPNTVRFDLSAPNALFVSEGLGNWILPQHLLGNVPRNQLRQTNFGEHPVGTGAWVLKEWRHDEQLTFEPNPYWWGGAPKIKRLVFRIVLNDQARIEAMEENAADVDDGIGPSGYATFVGDRAKLRLLHIPDLFIDFIYINFTKPGLDDLEVRRAMMYGWDRKALATGLARGDSQLATSIVPAGLRYWYTPKVRDYPYDPARARAILDASGYKLGPDGVRVRGAVRLAYTLTVPGNGGANQDFVAEYQADMRDIGIAISIQTIDYATFLQRMEEMKYELALSGWGGVPDPDQMTLLGSDQFPPAGNNQMHYKNPAMDRVLRLGLVTVDKAKRRPYYDAMQRIVAEDVPILYYEWPYYRCAIAPRVRFDFARALPGIYLFRNVTTWTLNG